MKHLSHSLDTSDDVYASHYGNGWESPVRLKVCALKWEEHMVSLKAVPQTIFGSGTATVPCQRAACRTGDGDLVQAGDAEHDSCT